MFQAFQGTVQGALRSVENRVENALLRPSSRQELEHFYRLHNPSKLASVDLILAEHRGREADLFRMLHKKYPPQHPPIFEDKGVDFRVELLGLLRRHEPELLSSPEEETQLVDSILYAHVGKEAALIATVRR